jgi:exodeoxyribonuclease III
MWSALTWNILFGGEERFEAILALLSRVKPDVAVLQECLGWEEGDRLSRVAGALGVPYIEKHALLGHARPRPSGRRFHVAIVSRFAITHTKTYADPDHVGHVIVEAHVATPNAATTIFGTHFDSHGENQRLRDARTLCKIAHRDRIAAERVLVAGDLNALSTRDPYPHDFADKLQSAGTEKYGMPPRFEVMPLLEGHGLVDLRPDPWVTAMRDRGGVRIDYRTDYLLASPALASECKNVEVIASAGASDHEPVLARFA